MDAYFFFGDSKHAKAELDTSMGAVSRMNERLKDIDFKCSNNASTANSLDDSRIALKEACAKLNAKVGDISSRLESVDGTFQSLFEHMADLRARIFNEDDIDGPTSSDFRRAGDVDLVDNVDSGDFRRAWDIDLVDHVDPDDIPMLGHITNVVDFIPKLLKSFEWSVVVRIGHGVSGTDRVVYSIRPPCRFEDPGYLQYNLELDVPHQGSDNVYKARIVNAETGNAHGPEWISASISEGKSIEKSFVKWLLSFIENDFGDKLEDFV